MELLQGNLSGGVMKVVTRKGEGLFPSPREISLSCSCPDWATMCKHVAATLYGVGARLDDDPGLLFTLRGVDPTELVEDVVDQPMAGIGAGKGRVLETTDALSSVFGVDIDTDGVLAADAMPEPDKAGPKKKAVAKNKPGPNRSFSATETRREAGSKERS